MQNIDIVWFFKIATSDNKIFVNSSKLNEIRIQLLGYYTGDFEKIENITL